MQKNLKINQNRSHRPFFHKYHTKMFRFPIPVPVFVYTCACVSEFTLWSLSRPKPMTHQLSSPDFHAEEKSEQLTSIGQIKPELYRLRQGDQGDGKQDTCGKISFLLRYAFKWVHSDPSHHYLLSPRGSISYGIVTQCESMPLNTSVGYK